MKTPRLTVILVLVTLCIFALMAVLAPAMIEESQNVVIPHPAYEISPQATALHKTLTVGDLHSDSSLWQRDLLQRSDRGHVDIPRLREGNVALQMFTSVTKSPNGQNYEKNSSESLDIITLVAVMQGWPQATWTSLTARALHQAQRLQRMADQAPQQLQIIRSAADLETLLTRRNSGDTTIGGILGTEGSHALDGKLDNIDVLYEAGFRMMSLQHFFDNRLGGSLHGESGAGLTEFGRQAVDKMLARGIMIDVAHSAPQVVEDVLAASHASLIVSHTGFYGHCPSHRNISDALMHKIARAGGLIGVGYWDGAVCDPSPQSVVAAIRYGIDLVGEDHIALGSDYDGGTSVTFDTSEIAVLTDEMLKANFSETEIRKVMGENMMRFLRHNLPEGGQ
ncbi:MAG: dipeptidase [Halieaceae bacterium]|jgi:membrane dipeptidase|nr:dipeptidase [Halieaceae bacterium]